MFGVINCQAEHEDHVIHESFVFDDISYEREAYEEYLAFEEYLRTDASAEVKALVCDMEQDLVLLFEIIAKVSESILKKNSPLITDHSKDSAETIETVFNDLVDLINEINTISMDLIFNEAERDVMQAAELSEHILYIKNTLEEFIALLDTVQGVCGDCEASIAFLHLNTEKEQQVCSRFRAIFSQKAALSQKVFANSLSRLKIAIPEIRSIFHEMLDSSVQFVEMTGCSGDSYVYFMNTRMQNLVNLYNQIAQEFSSKKFSKYEGKHSEELTQEEIVEVFELYTEFSHIVKKFARQLLIEIETVS